MTTIADLLLRFSSDFSELNSGLAGAENRIKNFGSSVLSVTAAVSTAFAATTTGAALLVKNSAEQAREIEKLATLADVSIERIQSLGYASQQTNISAEKMADILKDTSDKLGDWTLAGAGGFRDFFEQVAPKVGITAEELSKLSSDEVLVAVKKAMDQANVPMKEQIFLMESIANDSSALLPLLANKGKILRDLESDYRGLNVAMSEYDISKFKEMDKQLTDIGLKLQRSFANAVLGASDQINWLSNQINNALDFWGRKFDALKDVPSTQGGIIEKQLNNNDLIKNINSELTKAEGRLAELQKKAEGKSSRPYWMKDDAEFITATSYTRRSINTDSQIAETRKQIETLKKEQSQLLKESEKLQSLYNDTLGVTKNNDRQSKIEQPKFRGTSVSIATANRPNYDDNSLNTFDSLYANDLEKLKLANQQRLKEIANFNISQSELKRRGFDDVTSLREQYSQQENAYYQQQLLDYQAKQQQDNAEKYASLQSIYLSELEQAQLHHQQQLEQINNFSVSELEAQRLGFENLAALKDEFRQREADKHISALEEYSERDRRQKEEELKREEELIRQKETINTQRVSAISDFAGQVAKLQNSENERAAKVGRAAAKLQIMIQGYQAAMSAYAALSGIPVVGPALGAAAAGVAIGFAISTAAKVDSLQGQAHEGITSIPMDGTWNLEQGERVYTNESANKLDTMYQVIMSHSRQNYINDPAYGHAQQLAGMTQINNIINIIGAPGTTRVERQAGQNGEDITNVFLTDLSSDGRMSQAITRTFGVNRKGM